MTQPLGTRGFNHLLIAALAELELHCLTLQYLGNANSDPDFLICVAAQWALPTSGMLLALPSVAFGRPVHAATLALASRTYHPDTRATNCITAGTINLSQHGYIVAANTN